jgi:hypothetical protein
MILGIFADVRFSWEGRPPCRRTNHFWLHNEEKNGTPRRPSLPKMNEFLVGRVAEARALQATPSSDLAGSRYQQQWPITPVSRRSPVPCQAPSNSLKECRVTTVGMESTGVYCIPLRQKLETACFWLRGKRI